VSDGFGIEFETPEGERLGFEWDAERLASLQPDATAAPVWRLAGELDWDEVERVRVLSARLADGRLLVLAAVQPAGSEGHGDEFVAGLLGTPGAFTQLDEALISTEYGSDDLPRRVGLELYREPSGLPIRLAADVSGTARDANSGIERISAALSLRGDGGAGALDQLTRV
jgi:hypothetical protein